MATPKNFTRRSASIPARLIRERAFHLLPVYYVLQLSDLGREAIRHSGSYRFADHLYTAKPSGHGVLGRAVDALLLSLPAARAFQRRFLKARGAMRAAIEGTSGGRAVRVLAVPCGIPRDLVELVGVLRHERADLIDRIEYHGLDIDPAALEAAERMVAAHDIRGTHFHCGDALSPDDYPHGLFRCAVSTGLGEFLTDAELASFHRCVYDALEPEGVFFTSATTSEPLSASLLRMVELEAHYRSSAELLRSLRPLGWRRLSIEPDKTGFQTFLTAVK